MKITEKQLKQIIKESVKKVLNEIDLSYYKQSQNERLDAARELLLKFGSIERIPQIVRNEYGEELAQLSMF